MGFLAFRDPLLGLERKNDQALDDHQLAAQFGYRKWRKRFDEEDLDVSAPPPGRLAVSSGD